MRRYTLAGFATLGTRQSRVIEVAGESATVDAARSFAASPRTAAVVAPLEDYDDTPFQDATDPSISLTLADIELWKDGAYVKNYARPRPVEEV